MRGGIHATIMQLEQKSNTASAEPAGDLNDAEMFSPEDWALHDGIQAPSLRPMSPPKRELPPENEDEQRDT